MKELAAILIPGNMCDARMWNGGDNCIRRCLQRLTGQPPVDADVFRDNSIADMADRSLATTDGPLLLVGFSMGAIVAVEMAVLAPDRVRGLVLAGFNASADLPERAAQRPLQQCAVRQGHLRQIVVEQLKPNYLAASNRREEALRAILTDMAMAVGPDAFVAQSEALQMRKNRIPDLSQIRCPVLFLTGREDVLCPPEWHQRWAALTPGSQVKVIENAGHMAPLEQPLGFAQSISDWFQIQKQRLAA
ncbi:MAG: alpha/beta fold hydrolase [Limnohabitans sp.]